MEFFTRLFDTADFPARWTCGRWSAGHGWLHVLSDLGIWGAYLAIPVVLVSFVQRRGDLPFRLIFCLFGAFILLCGTTHLMEALIFWWPAYRLAGVIKLATAVVSWATVAALVPIVPKVLTMRSPEQFEAALAERTAALDQANADLRRLAADLSEAGRRKDEFLATLAHELRNPLAPIRNGLSILRAPALPAPAAERTREMMDRQLTHMVRLVDDLMDVSRISRGKIGLRPERVELAAVVRSAVETSQPLLDAAGHRFTVTLPPAPVFLDADPTRLAQVFANLLNNAAKYTEPGGAVSLTAVRDGDAVTVTVADTGVGVAAPLLPRLFDLFTQADASLERAQGGLGIGLTLVKRLTEMHGGTVEARSDGPGRGCEFTVRLPVPPADPAAAAAATATAAAANVTLKILVADDNADGAASLADVLRLMGHDVRTAGDGAAAVEAFAAFRPDVALLDIGMPKLNGYEACRRIRDLPGAKAVLIVACTGWGQDSDRRRAADAGFDTHMVKPVDHAELTRLLATRRPAG